MSPHHAALTPTQAVTLAGAYADLVFGTSTPEFTADVAAAFLREQNRQQSNPHKESEALLVACFGESAVKALRTVGGFAARVREVPAPKASEGEEMCANMSPSAFLCDAARGHKDCHATHLAGGLIHFWSQTAPAALTVADFDATTVEAVTRCSICHRPNGLHGQIHVRHPEGGGGINKPCPNSSLVVPAPRASEWLSLDAVPADVRKVRDKDGDEYRRRSNGGWKLRESGNRHWTKLYLPAADYDHYAPFVAAADGNE